MFGSNILHRTKMLSGSGFSFWDQILNGTWPRSLIATSYTERDGVYTNSGELLFEKIKLTCSSVVS